MEKEKKKKMIYGFLKLVLNFFRDFFTDLFSIFKDDQSSIGEDDLRWRTVESGEFSRQTGQSNIKFKYSEMNKENKLND
jgi:hypothetical protein